VLGLVIFAALFYLTARRGATDPVCGMKVDRSKALTAEHAGRTYFFCSEHCRSQFQTDPDGYTQRNPAAAEAHAAGHAH
jgi:YHS domain-containing protein